MKQHSQHHRRSRSGAILLTVCLLFLVLLSSCGGEPDRGQDASSVSTTEPAIADGEISQTGAETDADSVPTAAVDPNDSGDPNELPRIPVP